MKIIKFKVFNQQEFIDWQKEKIRNISQVSPVIQSFGGDVSELGSVDLQSNVSVFVLYWEEE